LDSSLILTFNDHLYLTTNFHQVPGWSFSCILTAVYKLDISHLLETKNQHIFLH